MLVERSSIEFQDILNPKEIHFYHVHSDVL